MCSCEKEISVDDSLKATYNMVTCAPVSGHQLSLIISKSRHFLSRERIRPIDDVSATIRLNGVVYPATSAADGKYTFNCTPQGGDLVELLLSSPDCPPLTISSRQPQAPSFEIANVSVDSNVYYYYYHFNIRLNDPVGQNYYRIAARMATITTTDSTIDTSSYSIARLVNYGTTSAPVLSFEVPTSSEEGYSTEPQLYFNDVTFDGKSYQFSCTIQCDKYITRHKKALIRLVLSSLTRDQYLYERALYAERSRNHDNPLEELVQLHCNIHTDSWLGLLGGISNTSRQCVIE